MSERSRENAAAVEDFLGRIDQLLISPATAQHYADLNRGCSPNTARVSGRAGVHSISRRSGSRTTTFGLPRVRWSTTPFSLARISHAVATLPAEPVENVIRWWLTPAGSMP
ncbi:MAG TPA: hypothetical protein VNA69_04950 [Thermoanaerobaculia bacterium]|nr:hypothetical protein [Thermoanaerobaculia bacterium]